MSGIVKISIEPNASVSIPGGEPGYAPRECSVPDWVAEEIKATWRAARDAGGEMQAFRIIERMVDRLGYGRRDNNPSLAPNNMLSVSGERKETDAKH